MRTYNLDLLDRSDYGGFWQRTLAWLLDTLILCVPSIAGAVLISLWVAPETSYSYGRVMEAAVALGLGVIYSIYFWVGKWHATPGKRALGLVVLSEDGCVPDMGKSAWRVVGQFISGLLVVGPLFVVTDGRRQALHDLIAGTVVVKKRSVDRVEIGDPGANVHETI